MSSLMWELRVLIGFESEGDMIKMMLQEVLKGFESRHNSSYWDLTEYFGFGVSAHSLLDGKRMANTDNINRYLLGYCDKTVEDVRNDFAEEYIMLSLRTSKGIDLIKLKGYGVDLLTDKHDEIQKLYKDGLIDVSDGFVRLKDDAFYIMNGIITMLI